VIRFHSCHISDTLISLNSLGDNLGCPDDLPLDDDREHLTTIDKKCVFPCRRRTAELTVTTHRWFLSVCFRKADTARPAPPAEV
jgi:hypothetical protein